MSRPRRGNCTRANLGGGGGVNRVASHAPPHMTVLASTKRPMEINRNEIRRYSPCTYKYIYGRDNCRDNICAL